MADLDLLHFEQLKAEVQAEYLKNHHPSYDEISSGKELILFIFKRIYEKKAKEILAKSLSILISKTVPSSKLPRIDMLNLLPFIQVINLGMILRKIIFLLMKFISEHENHQKLLLQMKKN